MDMANAASASALGGTHQIVVAGAGYAGLHVAGLGSPDAQYLVPLLASKPSPILYARFARHPGKR
jgi:hypothetical protein